MFIKRCRLMFNKSLLLGYIFVFNGGIFFLLDIYGEKVYKIKFEG